MLHGNQIRLGLGRRKGDPIKRFWSKVDKTGSCWVWTATTHEEGYGKFFVDGKHWQAHRYSMHISKGLDPNKPLVCHTCDNPPCVNPNHLYNGTVKDNKRDEVERNTTNKYWKRNR